MLVSMSLKTRFPHLDFELSQAIRFAQETGVRTIEFADDGRTLFDGVAHPDFRSLYASRDDRIQVVYAIAAGDHIKIGYTSNLKSRLSSLQNGSAVLLDVLAAWPGGPQQEKALHAKLSSYRAYGEWFRDTVAVRKAIQRASGIDML